MEQERIAIIGGSGFLGTRLISIFKASNKSEYKVFDIEKSPDNEDKFNFFDAKTLNDISSFDGFSTIINFAAAHRDDVKPKSLYFDTNVNGAINTCSIAKKCNINKIIFTSSVAIFGFAPPNTDENGEPNYFNEYGRTKYLAEQVYKEWQAEDSQNRCLVIIRPTVIFGEGNRGNVYNLLKQIASGKFLMFGNGKNKKSMAYVENVAAFVDYSLQFKQGLHIYNYIDKPDLDMNTLVSEARKTLFGKNNVGLRFPAFIGISVGYFADIFAKIIRKNLPVSSIRVKKFMGTTQFSSSVGESGFIAPVSLQEGLARTIRYEFIEDNSKNRTFDTE